MEKKKLIMCDCFGVVASPILPPWFKKTFGNEKGEFLATYYCTKGDLGKMSLFDIAKEMEEDYNLGKAEDIYNNWIHSSTSNTELLDFLKSLKDEYEIVLASNAMEGLVEDVFALQHVEGVFDRLFVSWEMEEIKPFKEFYLKIINSYDHKFEEMYMIDDHKSNFMELPEIGVIGLHYTSVEDLKKQLGK